MTVHTPRQSIVNDTIRILSAKVNLNLKNLPNRPNFFDKPGEIRIINIYICRSRGGKVR